ncbi:hypothetical protein DID88_002505 [Monilinia fructigena]|uniref:Uncharacterized protein n=1 Tax=Monilinia fructigena TaxID=38457 RepID=A0A395IPI9_9HELO|nr:hypothetical protein DID88_002505 [Monilinia fructigena]
MENINHDADFDSGRHYICPFSSEESKWYEAISAEYNGDYITGHIVSRRLSFHYMDFSSAMYSISTECSFLVDTIFDSRTRLLQHWISGPRKGSGIWDSRLNTGDFLVIEIAFEKSHQEGSMSHLFSEMLNKVKNKVRWIFVWPGRIIVDGAPRMLSGKPSYLLASEDEKSTAIAFWRAKGFRRIGLSHWFCYAMADNDASRNLAERDDCYNSDDEVDERWATTSLHTDSSEFEDDENQEDHEDDRLDEDDELYDDDDFYDDELYEDHEDDAVRSEQPVGLEQSPALSDTPNPETSDIDMGESDNINISINTHNEPDNRNFKIPRSNNINIELHPEQVNNNNVKINAKAIAAQNDSGHQRASEEPNLSDEDETIFVMEDL